MKKALWQLSPARQPAPGIYYYKDGRRIEGKHDRLTGAVSELLRGNVSGLSGDIDQCELTQEERKAGIDIGTLVA